MDLLWSLFGSFCWCKISQLTFLWEGISIVANVPRIAGAANGLLVPDPHFKALHGLGFTFLSGPILSDHYAGGSWGLLAYCMVCYCDHLSAGVWRVAICAKAGRLQSSIGQISHPYGSGSTICMLDQSGIQAGLDQGGMGANLSDGSSGYSPYPRSDVPPASAQIYSSKEMV